MTRLPAALLISLALPVFHAMADDKADVAAITKKATENVVKLLKDDSLDEETGKKKVREELEKVFDFPLTAKLTLGRKYWPVFNKEQREEFQDLFIKQLLDSYFKKAKMFSNQKIEYEEPKKVKTKLHAAINFVDKGEKITINNKFYKSSRGWRAYDMEIQGISVVRSYGSQYAAILRKGSAADLLEKMRKKELSKEPKSK